MSYDDTKAKRQRIQQALIDAGYPCGPEGADGVFGTDTADAITKFRKDRGIVYPPHPATIDTDLMRELGLLTIQDPAIVGVAAAKGIDLLNLIKLIGLVQSFMKGTTKMDGTKPWYTSQTVWASALAILGTVLSFFHIDLGPADQATISQAVIEIVTAASSLWAIIGRLRATKAIG